HLQADVGGRPAVAKDLLVERLAAAHPEAEPALEEPLGGRGRLGEHGGVNPYGGTGHTRRHLETGLRRDGADDGPHEGALALGLRPGVVVIGDQHRREPGLLGLARRAEQEAGPVLLAREEAAHSRHREPSRAQDERAAALPPLRPARFFCAVVPPWEGLLPEPDFLPPRLDEPGELAMRAARCLDMPFFLRPSY